MKTVPAAQPSELPALPTPLWKRRWFQNSAVILLGILGLYGLVYRDVVSRARHSYQQAELYMSWYQDPAAKQKHFDDVLSGQRSDLQKQLDDKKISAQEFHRRLDAFQFDHDFALSESSLKYAYQWYKDTYELFSPPESKWVREARVKAPKVLELWKQELRSQKIPFDDTMFE